MNRPGRRAWLSRCLPGLLPGLMPGLLPGVLPSFLPGLLPNFCRLAGAAAGLLGPLAAQAGKQAEEPLADAVRGALSAAIASAAPPKLVFVAAAARLDFLRWQGAMSDRLKHRKTEAHTRLEFLETVWYESRRAGLEPALVLGLVQVESGFRKYAISSAGAL